MGKHKPVYHPATDCGDYVVATNCADFKVTGKKLEQHLYYSHSTKPGHLKTINMKDLRNKKGGGEVLRRTVSAMLPKNRLRDIRLARLKTYEGPTHPHSKNLVKRMEGNIQDINSSTAWIYASSDNVAKRSSNFSSCSL